MNNTQQLAGQVLGVASGSGCLSKRLHTGSPSGPGCIGTDDPARWQHLLWFEGEVWAAALLDDCLQHVPTYEELYGHFVRWKDSGESPWIRVCLQNGDNFMKTYTENYEAGDIVTGKSGHSIMLRIVSVISTTQVEVKPASGFSKKESWIEEISDLRNVTKGDPL